MQSLPPIRPAASKTAKSKGDAALEPHNMATSLTAPINATTASAADGINRNQLRQEAGRRVQHITHGVAEQQTYLDMLHHIREQFAHTSQQPLRPLVLPPQWPSTARPREPQTARFSRGIALSNAVLRRGEATRPATATGGEGGEETAAGVVRARTSSWQLGSPTAAAASYEPTELPSTSTGFAHAHRWGATDTADRTFFQRRLQDAANAAAAAEEGEESGRGISDGVPALLDLSPLDQLPTLEEKMAYLASLETASRQHVLACERWDQQVVSEMMAVRYVTFVLKPCMDALRLDEAEEREKINQQEDRLSFYLFHESPLVEAIGEGLKAMKARELQLDRILGLAPQSALKTPEPIDNAAATDGAGNSPFAAGEPHHRARSSIASLSASRPSVGGHSNTIHSTAGGGGVAAPEARRILQQYVRQRHGADIEAASSPMSPSAPPKAWSPSTQVTYLGVGHKDGFRRSSALVLPPAPSAHAPRRNAVGIADYVALLDECMLQGDHIRRLEQQARVDLNRECYEEQQVVLEWQRRRMHLERLLYWRQQREGAVQDEVAALTEVNVGAPLDPKLVLLLEMVEEAEEEAREALCAEERQCSEDEVWATSRALRDQYDEAQLEKACWSAFDTDVVQAEAVSKQHLVVHEEASLRHCSETAAMAVLEAKLAHGMSQLHVLWRVASSPAHCAALRVLQAAFRRSLRGKLGWRATNSAVGRQISDARNAKKIVAGRTTLQSFKDALAAEEAQLRREQEAQDIRAQNVLFAGEAADRVAVSSEQDLLRQGIRRASVLHVAEVFVPVFERLVALEERERMQIEVEEDVDDEALRRSHAGLTAVITRKARARHDEAAARRALVVEERGVWRELLGGEADTREHLRLDAEADEAIRRADRFTFATAALEASRRYRDGAFAAYVHHITTAQLELLGYDAADSAGRSAILAEESSAATQLFADLSVEACATYARTLLGERQIEFNRAHQHALVVSETEQRADLLMTQSIGWQALQPMLRQTLSGPLRELIERRGAVNAISTWYRAVRNGDVGRAVSQQRLREDLHRYRDERNLRSQQIAQRLHTQQVREQLDVLMREIQDEEVGALQQQLDILVLKEEPRERASVESMQDIVLGILVRNAEAQTAEVRRQLVNTEALVWQQESYERKLIIKACRRTFAELLERERLQLSEDHFAKRIQRAWTAYAARKKQAEVMAEQRRRLAALEAQARAAVELEALENFAVTMQKPHAAVQGLDAHFYETLCHAYGELCATVLASDAAQEWRERVALLWEMRYDRCDFCLCSEEARARRALTLEFRQPFVRVAELRVAEAHQRDALTAERTAFLLRILAREEQAHRAAVAAAEAEKRAADFVASAPDAHQDEL